MVKSIERCRLQLEKQGQGVRDWKLQGNEIMLKREGNGIGKGKYIGVMVLVCAR